ncbi:MAG: hypothetical protein A3E83_07530 [Gammaproteobacteria bacterium RIFCSPHIGHO2_12_FULL_41_20]|nr:MAG: hypothetical protein A3E83_07530 [Gammaproteobacteria bacterium RIFCSPHIGHO2_12_FULL_41_20]
MTEQQATICYQDSQFIISGDLTFATVPVVWNKSQPMLDGKAQLLLDFSRVTSSNSAGLALILEWLKYAKYHNKKIQLHHLPPQLLTIARVAGLDALLHEYQKTD